MENLAQRREFYDSAFGKCCVSVCNEILSHSVTGKSVEQYLLRLFCGKTEHSVVWGVLNGGKARKEDLAKFWDTCARPPLQEEAAFWETKLQNFSEGEGTSHIARAWAGLLCYANPNMEESETMPGFGGPLQMVSTASQFTIAMSVSFDRRFCVTKGGYVGLVPPLTKVDDVVCLFLGCETPFLIRPVNVATVGIVSTRRRAFLVGECYMHGMMKGEMMTLDKDEILFALE